MSMPEPAPTINKANEASTEEYDALTDWLNKHLQTALVKSLDVWVQRPQLYIPPTATQGLDELSSCLIIWATKNRRPIRYYTPAVIASLARALIRGQYIEDTVVSEYKSNILPEATFAEWFAFNWSMLLNGSIRYTSHRRDAIISQMLLLPGYQVPRNPWSKSLEAIAGDVMSQFRRLLQTYQLVATIIALDSSRGASSIGEPVITEEFNNKGGLANILHAVGSPVILPKEFDNQERDSTNGYGLMIYQPDGSPRYMVTDEINIAGKPLDTARHILSLESLWAKAADYGTSWNVRDCFQEIQTLLPRFESENPTADILLQLRRVLKHCLCRMTNHVCFKVMTIPKRTSSHYSRPYDDDEIDDIEIPRAFLVEVRYHGNSTAPHTNILFGNLVIGQEGEIWGLGVEMGTKFEHGIAVLAFDDGTMRPAAGGALLPTDREAEYKRIIKGLEATDKEVVSIGGLQEP